jgi:hypothetical protein
MRNEIGIGVMTLLLLSGCSAPGSGGVEQPTLPSQSIEISPPVEDVPDYARFVEIRDSSPAAAMTAAPVAPSRVDIADLQISMDVASVGVNSLGLMDLPERVDVAGWYRFGSAPGSERGATVIAAHVDSLRYGLGPFARLRDAPVGTRVTLTLADGTARSYAISSIEKTLKSDIPIANVFDRDGAARLILITCGGQFNRTSRTYSDNVIVTALPVA